MVKAVIFDLDDTLISEKEYIKSGYHHISNILSDTIHIDKEFIFTDLMELFETSPKKVFNRFYEKYDLEYSTKMVFELVNEYRGHYPNIKFYDDVLPCLSKLKKSGMKIGIITDGYAIAQHQKLRAVGADKYFDEIIVTDDFGRDYWKPHSKSFELMRDRLEIDFNEMVYVGDNPDKDFYISKIYPIKTVRIYRDGVHKDNCYLEEIREDFIIDNLISLIEIVRRER